MEIKIGTLNCQNNIINRNGGIQESGIDNSKILANHIQGNDYFCFGTQELTRNISLNLTKNLKNCGCYKLYGNYRFGSSNIIKSINSIESYNENNCIITNRLVVYKETNKLPWISRNPKELIESITKGSIMPRIATGILIDDEYVGKVFVLNTHLDYQIPSIQHKQLKELLKLVKEVNYFFPVILTGDFNMEVGNPYFDEFIDSLKSLNIKRVEVNDKTNAEKFSNKTAIDHIFIPKDWLVLKSGIIEDLKISIITDHKGVYAKVKIK